MNRKEQYQLWDDFLKKWPLEKIKKMTLDEYTKVGSKNSAGYFALYCY